VFQGDRFFRAYPSIVQQSNPRVNLFTFLLDMVNEPLGSEGDLRRTGSPSPIVLRISSPFAFVGSDLRFIQAALAEYKFAGFEKTVNRTFPFRLTLKS